MILLCFSLLRFSYPWLLTPMSSYRNPLKVVWHKFICRYIYPWCIYSPLIFNMAVTLQTLPAGPGSCLWPPSRLGFWSGPRPPGFKPELGPVLALWVFWHSWAYSGESPRLSLGTGYFTKAIFFLSKCWSLFFRIPWDSFIFSLPISFLGTKKSFMNLFTQSSKYLVSKFNGSSIVSYMYRIYLNRTYGFFSKLALCKLKIELMFL